MKYFILYTSNHDGSFEENYFKAKSFKHLYDRIKYYSDGALVTSSFALYTSNIECGFLREIDLKYHPELTKRDFKVLDENKSYCKSELSDR